MGREPITYVIEYCRTPSWIHQRTDQCHTGDLPLLVSVGYNTTQAVERIEQELPASDDRTLIVDFIRSSSRGIVRGNMEG